MNLIGTMSSVSAIHPDPDPHTENERAAEKPFKYSADEFADIQILRYRVPGWDSLSLRQKEYIYHLGEAAKWGRDILFDQNFKYNLRIRKVLEKIIEEYREDKNNENYRDFLIYAKRVFFSNGIHHHYAEDKFIPGCDRAYFKSLMVSTGQEALCEELLPVIYDPHLYPCRRYTGGDKELLTASSVNFYQGGVTREEADAFYARMEDPADPSPLSYGLNSKLIKKDGVLKEEVWKTGGLYGKSIEKIVEHLEAASKVAENESQKEYIASLTEYYRTGDLKIWNRYNIGWVQDQESQVDFINGFIETYNDPLGRKGTWEANVNFKDPEASRRTQIISTHAQWFEDHSPIDPQFKKKKVKGVSAKVINVVCLGGDCYPATPIGINLPNADWIRKEYGSKSVTIANITDAYDKALQESPRSMLTEFSWDENEIALIKRYGTLTSNLHTDLHECLGHGSGQLLSGVSPNSLGEYSSAIEEARADLFALYYLADSKLTELGVLPDRNAYKAEYMNFIRNGIFTQFSRIELGKSNTEAHMQDRKLIAQWCYEQGRAENVIEKKIRDGKTYFVINDFGRLRTLFGRLLREIQRIKSEGDYRAGKSLIDTYAIHIDPILHKEVKERFEALNLKPYKGFINPDIVPVADPADGHITDYEIIYCNDYLGQMLHYGRHYSI